MLRAAKIIFLFVILGGIFVPASFAAESPGAQSAMVSSARVPFVANEGQIASPEVKYYAKTFGGTVYALADGKIVYSLPKYDAVPNTSTSARAPAGSVILQERLRGNLTAEPLGAGKSRTAVNSFIGNRPDKWKTNLSAFDRLDFGEVYEGVSLLLSAHGNNVEKIFVLSPGADPRDIAFGFEGASGIEITSDGQLEIQTALGAVYFTRPVAWQIDDTGKDTAGPEAHALPSAIDSSQGRATASTPCRPNSIPVEVSYVLDEDGTVRFELGPYDRNKVLVIDPLLASTFIGGGGADAVQSMAVDSQTNVYVAGYTDSGEFPVTNSPYQQTLGGGYDAFVSKFDANLGSLSASTYLGGSSNDYVYDLGVNTDETRIWLAGYTESTNFPCGASSMNSNYNGNGDAFVAVLSSDLGTPFQATYLGGSNLDSAAAIAMDNASRRQYVVGYTESANFPVTNLSGYATNYHGARDAFAVVFSNDVSSLKCGTFLGGTNADEAAGVVVMPGTGMTNFVYVVGSTSSTNFPVTNGYQMTNGGSYDAFVSRLSALLTNLPSSTYLGGTGSDMAYAVGHDISNKLYVAGSTRSGNFPQNPTNNEYLTGYANTYRGGQDIFLTCLTNNASNLYASTFIGGTNNDVAKCLVVDSNTNRVYVYLAGYTDSSNFPTTSAAYDRSYNGGEDAFTLYFDGRLTNLYASTYLGGGANDRSLALDFAPDSNTLFVAGSTASSDFPSSDTAYQNVFGGTNDGFITKFPASLAYGTVKWKKSLEYSASRCSSPALTWDGTLVVGNSTSLYAFTRSGTERWQASITSSVAIQAQILAGLGSPAVGTNDVIYINTSNGTVYAITTAGIITELFKTTPLVRWSSIALGNENQLIFSQDSKLYSVGANGERRWTNSLAGNNYSSPAISSNGIIYAGDSDSPAKLYAICSDGSISNTWTMASAMYSSPALDTNGTIYTASGSKLYAFSPDGLITQTWSADGNILSSPAIGTNGLIYVGGGSNLYAFNTNGTTAKVWHTGNPVKSSPAISADGSIIVGAAQPDEPGFVYSFNPDGTTNWVCETDYEIHFQSPLIDSEGTIYISDIWYVYAIYGSQPPAESAWPMFRHDALRTGNQGLNVASFLRPSGLAASKYGTFTNYVHVGWNASSNAVSYELWRNTNDSTAGATRIRRLTQTNYNDSSVDAGKIYYYWVKVKTPVALSVFSDSDSGGVPPEPPENVTATKGVPTNYIQVTWQASSNATVYHIYRNRDNTNTPAYLASTAGTNYSDYSVEPSFRYYYWVKASNTVAGGSGLSSNDYGGIPCWPPSGLSASQGAYVRSVALSWNSSTGASSYVVYRNTENDSSAAGIIAYTSALGTNDYAGTPLRRYYYWIRTTNEFGLSGFGGPSMGWSLLAPPVSVSASAGAYSNMIRVSWIAGSTDATAHVIFRSESSDPATAIRQSEVVYFSSTATNYDDTAITRGPAYYYWVAAKNNYGTSAWTAANSPGGTAPATPSDLNASDGTYSNMVKVAWNPSPGATTYTVYRGETFDSSSAALLGSSSSNYYEDTSALHGVIYYYWVKAGNNYGISSLSTFNSGWRGMVPPDNVTAGNGSSTSEVSVTWSAAPDASVYELWRGMSDDSSSASRLANNIAAIYYSDLSATPGTAYYYWVKSKRGNYTSAFSGSDRGYRSVGLLDIAVSDFVFVPTLFGPLAHPSAVSFKISNLSALDMVEPNNTVQYDLYLSQNAVFGGDDYWIGGSNTALPLNAGASTRVVCPASVKSAITIPSGIAGDYYVFVFVNHCLPSGWFDPNLANNAAVRLGNSIAIASATAIQPIWNDYDGDGKTDFAVYQSSTGTWRFWLSTTSYAQIDLAGLGGVGYSVVPRDYDGDGMFDLAVYQPATGGWRVCLSSSGYQTVVVAGWGGAGQYAVQADYDGDGRADPAIYQSSNGKWRVWLSGSGYMEVNVYGLGGTGWQSVPADYDGDGKTDPAVYQAGTWQIMLSGSGYALTQVLLPSSAYSLAVPGDYDGDGRVDPAVYYSSGGGWRFWLSSIAYNEISVAGWGGTGQTAVPGDYDGDGRVDAAVYWETMGIWRLWLSSCGYSETDVLKAGGEGFHAITPGE